MKISPKIISIIFFFFIVITQKLYAAEKIKIGLLVPLSGNDNKIVKSILQSVRLAINKINNGIAVIIEALLFINKIYRTINIDERIKKTVLNTLIIDKECFNKFKKLIFDGPKYLIPFTDENAAVSRATFVSEPEKLLHVAFSFTILSTVDLGKQV